MRRVLPMLLSLAALILSASATAQTVGPGGAPSFQIGVFGPNAGDRGSVGQSLVSPGGNLTSFSFYIADTIDAGNVRFVFAPLNDTTPGTPLYVSSDTALPDGATLSFSGFSIATDENQRYIGYLTSYGVTNPGRYTVGSYSGTIYADGATLYSDSPANPTGLAFTTHSSDTAFTAMFEAVPEPGAWAMMIAGFGAIGGALRRRRQVSSPA